MIDIKSNNSLQILDKMKEGRVGRMYYNSKSVMFDIINGQC